MAPVERGRGKGNGLRMKYGIPTSEGAGIFVFQDREIRCSLPKILADWHSSLLNVRNYMIFEHKHFKLILYAMILGR
jgi:hypothetical protein